MTSSDVTTPSQLMHAVRFDVRLREPRAATAIAADLAAHPRLATTAKFDSNRVFELGRRYGFQGRLFAHAIVVANDLMIRGRSVKGWAFVPQEGNTLLSTVEAFLLQTRPADAEAIASRLGRGSRRAPALGCHQRRRRPPTPPAAPPPTMLQGEDARGTAPRPRVRGAHLSLVAPWRRARAGSGRGADVLVVDLGAAAAARATIVVAAVLDRRRRHGDRLGLSS